MKNLIPKLILLFAILFPSMLNAQVQSSYPSASATLFLDFDGHYVHSAGWNAGNTFYCQPAALTTAQIDEMFNRVAEDYRPFNINVTTDSAKFLAAPLNKRMRIIITPTSSWYPVNVGGVSYVGSFTWGDNTPGFVFSDKLGNNTKYISECITHESGHTVGLSHQSRYDANCSLLEQYNVGKGIGETSWAPVMGNSYYRNMTGWNDGPTPFGCANTQDNLTIITNVNGFTYRTDDYTDVRDASTYFLGSHSFSADGVITTNDDKDAFKYTLNQSVNFHLEARPFSMGGNAGANLDVAIDMYNASNTLIRSFNPENSLSVSVDTVLNAGTYYFVVSGAGNENISNYGSLGSYTLMGFFGALAVKDIKLTGAADKNKHQLNWSIVADEPIVAQVLETSADGINFMPLSAINPLQKTFINTTNHNVSIFYRLKVTSALDQTAYSNVIALKSNVSVKGFDVSARVQHEITVNAADNYNYILSDANGRLIAQGTGAKGLNKINVNRQPGGVYILQLLNNNERQTERIIKQ